MKIDKEQQNAVDNILEDLREFKTIEIVEILKEVMVIKVLIEDNKK